MYIILEKSDRPASNGFNDADVVNASFKTIKAAKDWIRSDALEHFDPDSIHDDFGEHCSQFVICEMIETVDPIPKIKVSITLKQAQDKPK